MHPNRRRKKRPNYGMRMIELIRGNNGFGFTISGQAPCILSCIVNGSPAERAGLRPGDYLIAVNGLNVSKVPHDDVVRIIGQTPGVLNLQISENIFYSDSSEEEFVSVNRHKPKYPNRIRHKQNANSSVYRAEKVVQDLQSGALFNEKYLQDVQLAAEEGCEELLQNFNIENKNIADVSATVNANKALIEKMLQQRMREVVAASCANINSSSVTNNYQPVAKNPVGNPSKAKPRKRIISKSAIPSGQSPTTYLEDLNDNGESDSETFPSAINFTEQELNNILYPSLQNAQKAFKSANIQNAIANFRAVVGYLGTIEMPKEPQVPGSRLQAIRSCIRRLRVEKKVHTLVLLSVYSHQVLLTNPHGLTLAEYPAEKITFSGVYADDKKFFGLVTGHGLFPDDLSEGSQEDNVTLSSSCHVFMVDARIQPHYKHTKRARVFRIECTVDPETNQCQEFPDSAEPILHAISALYRSRQILTGLNNGQHPLVPEPGIIGAPGLVNVDGHLSPPQRSNTSSNSSNSDSGIGFRDEAGSHNSDRMFIVDLLDNAMNAHRQNLHHQAAESRLSLRAMRSGANLSTSDSSLHQIGKSNNHGPHSHRNTPTTGILKSAHTSPLTIGNLNSSSPMSADRLTVRAMPDPVGYLSPKKEAEPPLSNPQVSSNKVRNDSQKYNHKKHPKKSAAEKRLNVRATTNKSPIITDVLHVSSEQVKNKLHSYISSSKNSKFSPATRTPAISPLTVIGNQPVSSSSVLPNLVTYKLSPKVYGVVPSSCKPECRREPVIDSSDESQDGNHQLAWSSATSQYSDHMDSEIDTGIKGSKNWIGSSYFKKPSSKQRTVVKARSELGTVSDGELATSGGCSSIKPATSSATSSMIGLDRISSDINASIQGIGCNTENMSSSRCSSVTDHERGVDVGRVASWAANFEKLLEDPAGMHTFAEFLKSEFSQENILFWVASERYKSLKDAHQMKSRAKDIYEKHLGLGASEPVNVDSHARQIVQDNLENPTTELFNLAQKQIFDLMKFDCYSRFLKCQIYKDSLLQEMSGLPLPYQGDYTLNVNITWEQLDQIERDKAAKPSKSKDDSNEEKRKKSIIPWHRSKTKNPETKLLKDVDLRRSWRRKKKDGNKENKWLGGVRDDISVPSSDMTGSRTSLASVDLDRLQRHAVSHESLTSSEFVGESLKKDDTDFCRILLPDQSTTVLQVRMSETVRDLIVRLNERRALSFTAVDIYALNSDKALDQTKVISKLNNKEFRVEQRIIFRVDLPNKKTIGVKAKATKNVIDILRPILQKYGFKLENVVVHVNDEERKLNLNSCVTVLDNKRVIVKTLTEFAEWGYESSSPRYSLPNKYTKYSASLNEITNKVFEDLLKGKAQAQFDELGILDLDQKSNYFDDQASSLSDTRSSSSHQSGLLNLVRRSSFHLDYSKNRLSHKLKMNMLDLGNIKANGSDSVMNLRAVEDKPPLPKPRNKLTPTRLSDNDAISEMFEVWKRAQRCRLEDQRGTEINGELPEFLKPKSNDDGKGSKLDENQRTRKSSSHGIKNRLSYTRSDVDLELANTTPITCYDFIKTGGIIPSHQEAENYFCSNNPSPVSLDENFSRKFSLGDRVLTGQPEMRGRVHSAFSISNKNKRPVRRPVSHPVFGSETQNYLDDIIMYPTIQTGSHNHILMDKENIRTSPEGDLDKTLECAKDLDLDSVNDLNVTLKEY